MTKKLLSVKLTLKLKLEIKKVTKLKLNNDMQSAVD